VRARHRRKARPLRLPVHRLDRPDRSLAGELRRRSGLHRHLRLPAPAADLHARAHRERLHRVPERGLEHEFLHRRPRREQHLRHQRHRLSGPGCNLINNIFFNQTTASVNCAPTGFANRRKHIAYLDASDACISADTGFQAVNPLFVFLAANDYRIQFTSPAKDAGADTWLSNSYWANFTGFSPGWFGAAYDIGGIETW
jgi:hypothetical protein